MKSLSPAFPQSPHLSLLQTGFRAFLILGVAAVISALVWQGITAQGVPNPTQDQNPSAILLDIAILVFREGLECILVLSALTASLTGLLSRNKKPIAWGAGVGFIATILTWFMAVGILSDIGNNITALELQALTGLVAVIVLLGVMNWYFHKLYWGGWITMHNRQKKAILREQDQGTLTPKLIFSLGLLGFTSLYREGFEVVVILQGYNLKYGGWMIFEGMAVGLFLTGMVAILNFVAHQKLPYRKMLIFTGLMLGAVLLVMVGEEAQEMQLASWIGTHEIEWLKPFLPGWTGLWFSLFPTWETLTAQALVALLVIGSFFGARRQSGRQENGV